MENEDVLTMELSHLEKELNIEVYGLIGYEIIKDYDLLFDYENEKVYFLLPTFTNHFLENTYKNLKKEEVPLELDGHIPTIKLTIDEKNLTVGIDCGAEANLLNEQLFASLEKQMIVGKKEDLRGADKSSKPVNAGTINNLKIGTRSFKNVFTVFNDMEHLNKNYKTKLDGLIGYEILSKQKTLVSFKNNKLIFIN